MMFDIPIVALSLQIALVATGLTLPIGLITAWLLVRKNFRGKFLLDVFVSLPLALPPVVVGYVLLWLVGSHGWVGQISQGLFGSTLAFTWFAAVLASSVVSFPLVVRSFTVALAGVDPNLEVAAKGLGAGSLRTFLTVTLPLAQRGVIAGVLLGFVRALSEFGATIIVAGNIPGRTQTVPTAIFTRISSGDTNSAWRLAIVSLVLGVIALAVHNWLLNRPRSFNSSGLTRLNGPPTRFHSIYKWCDRNSDWMRLESLALGSRLFLVLRVQESRACSIALLVLSGLTAVTSKWMRQLGTQVLIGFGLCLRIGASELFIKMELCFRISMLRATSNLGGN